MSETDIKLTALILSALFVFTDSCLGANKYVRFSDKWCNYKVKVDGNRDFELALRGTIKLLFNWVPSVPETFVAKPEDIAKIRFSDIDASCIDQISAVTRMPLLPLDGLEAFRLALLKELNDTCQYEKIKLMGYYDPSALRLYEATSVCTLYVDALEGKTDINSVHEQLAKSNCRKNASPINCLANWKGRYNNISLMKIDVIEYGWGNCVVPFNKRNSMNNMAKRDKLAAQFLRKYKVKKLGCSSP